MPKYFKTFWECIKGEDMEEYDEGYDPAEEE